MIIILIIITAAIVVQGLRGEAIEHGIGYK